MRVSKATTPYLAPSPVPFLGQNVPTRPLIESRRHLRSRALRPTPKSELPETLVTKVQQLSFSNWQFQLKRSGFKNILRISDPATNTKRDLLVKSDNVVQLAFEAISNMVDDNVRQHFLIDGLPVYATHQIDPDTLLALYEQQHHSVRRPDNQARQSANKVEARFRNLLQRVGYHDWEFHLGKEPDEEHFFLQVRYQAPDNFGEDDTTQQNGRKYRLTQFMLDEEVIMTALAAVRAAEEHEVRELFRYQGRDIYGPHFPFPVLQALAEKAESGTNQKQQLDLIA